jgi:hypothetical protein
MPPATFCSACGQRLDVRPLRIGEIASSAIQGMLSFDAPALRTLRDLARGPGKVARAWIDGRRTSYLHPLRFLFVVGVVTLLTFEPIQQLRQNRLPSGQALYVVGFDSRPTFGLLAILVSLPVACTIALLGRPLGLRRSWLEWYVLCAYACGAGALLQLGVKVVGLALPTGWGGWLALAEFALPLLLLAWGARDLVDAGRRGRAVLVAALAPLVLIALIATVAALSH